jgi:hypothetical protein
MTSLRGIVISRGAELVIRLSSGARVRIPRQKDLRLGDAVYICYDYTSMVVREVYTEEEFLASDNIADDPVEWDAPEDLDVLDLAIEPHLCPVVSL